MVGLGFNTCCARDCQIAQTSFDFESPATGVFEVVQGGTAGGDPGEVILDPSTILATVALHPVASSPYVADVEAAGLLRIGGAVRLRFGYGNGDDQIARVERIDDVETESFFGTFFSPTFELSIVGSSRPPRTWSISGVGYSLEWAAFYFGVCGNGDFMISATRRGFNIGEPPTVSEIVVAPPTGRRAAVESEGDNVALTYFNFRETAEALPDLFSLDCPTCAPDCEICSDSHGPATATVRFEGWQSFRAFNNPNFGIIDPSNLNAAHAVDAIGNCRFVGYVPLPPTQGVPEPTAVVSLDLNGSNFLGLANRPLASAVIYNQDPRTAEGLIAVLCGGDWQSPDVLDDCDVPETAMSPVIVSQPPPGGFNGSPVARYSFGCRVVPEWPLPDSLDGIPNAWFAV